MLHFERHGGILMKLKLILLVFSLCLVASFSAIVFLQATPPGTVTHKETASSSKHMGVNPSDPEEQRIRHLIESALQIYSDETLPRGVKKLERVSVQKGDETQIIIRWAVNDWMRWAGSGNSYHLEASARSELKAMIGAIGLSDLNYDIIQFEGTLPINTGVGDLNEEVVIKAIFKYSAVQDYKITLPYVTVGLDEIKKERKRKKGRNSNKDVLNFAEAMWISSELRNEFR
jgi:hypothetical protein